MVKIQKTIYINRVSESSVVNVQLVDTFEIYQKLARDRCTRDYLPRKILPPVKKSLANIYLPVKFKVKFHRSK